MATQAQYNADPYIRRELVTAELDWLGDELCRRAGRPRTAAGTKGDRHHMRGAHRSQEFILRSALCTNRTYTVQSGLTALQERYIGGFDFTPGSVADMIAQSKRILAAMKAGLLDEVREFFGNVDGDQIVDGFDNLHDRAATSDSSHLWHWHLTIDRRHLTDRALMERILAIALGEDDDIMGALSADQQRGVAYTLLNVPDPAGGKVRVPLHVWCAKTDAALDAIAGRVGITPDQLAEVKAAAHAGALEAFDAAAYAAAIPDDVAQEVVDLLAARLAA